ncbi:MAG: hypothetical protein KC620_23440, partial [Myxococcales bacterium]|nr:hypothetical protein [Myxococcales bacterium]
MMLQIAALVSIDKRQVHDVLLPGISKRVFRGVSLAELLDDVTLHLMETIPQTTPERMPVYQLCPHLELRRVKVQAEIAGKGRRKQVWQGR